MHTIELYMPSRDSNGAAMPPMATLALRELIESTLLEVSGGFTEYAAVGAYRTDDGRVIRESVTVFRFFAEKESAGIKLAQLVAAMANQESVLVTVNSAPHFVRPDDVAA